MSQALGKITIRPGKKENKKPRNKQTTPTDKNKPKRHGESIQERNRAKRKTPQISLLSKETEGKIEEQECRNIEKITKEIISRGRTNSQQYWKIRKSITKQSGCDYDLVTEDGTKVTDPNEHKDILLNTMKIYTLPEKATPCTKNGPTT